MYTSLWTWFELTTLVVIGTDCTCQSNYHTITTTTAPLTTNNIMSRVLSYNENNCIIIEQIVLAIWNVLHYINMAEFGNLNHSILHIFCDLKAFSRLHRCCWRSAIWTILHCINVFEFGNLKHSMLLIFGILNCINVAYIWQCKHSRYCEICKLIIMYPDLSFAHSSIILFYFVILRYFYIW